MNIPTFALPVRTLLRPPFSTLTDQRCLVLLLDALLTTGRRTITTILRTVRHQAPGQASSSHRVCSRRRWSTWVMAHAVSRFLLDHEVPPGPVLLAGDDTVTEHPGPHVFGKGRHRDAVRSSHSSTAYRWGPKGVVMSMLVTWPFATRPGALPVLVALYRPPEWDRVPGTRQKTPAHLARLLLARLVRWFPARHCIVVGDSGYGTSATARFCSKHRLATHPHQLGQHQGQVSDTCQPRSPCPVIGVPVVGVHYVILTSRPLKDSTVVGWLEKIVDQVDQATCGGIPHDRGSRALL